MTKSLAGYERGSASNDPEKSLVLKATSVKFYYARDITRRAIDAVEISEVDQLSIVDGAGRVASWKVALNRQAQRSERFRDRYPFASGHRG